MCPDDVCAPRGLTPQARGRWKTTSVQLHLLIYDPVKFMSIHQVVLADRTTVLISLLSCRDIHIFKLSFPAKLIILNPWPLISEQNQVNKQPATCKKKTFFTVHLNVIQAFSRVYVNFPLSTRSKSLLIFASSVMSSCSLQLCLCTDNSCPIFRANSPNSFSGISRT